MTYQKDYDLINRYRAAGLTVRELANHLGMAPGTVSGKLCGFSAPLTYTQRKSVLTLIDKAEREKSGGDN